MAYFNSFTNTTVILGPTGSTWTLRSENDNIYAYQNQGTLWNASGVNGYPLLNQGTGSTGPTGPTGSSGEAGISQVLTWTLGNSQNSGEFNYNSGSNVWEFNITDNQGVNATNWANSIASLYPYTSTILNIVGKVTAGIMTSDPCGNSKADRANNPAQEPLVVMTPYFIPRNLALSSSNFFASEAVCQFPVLLDL
jgi:hypothetical protein